MKEGYIVWNLTTYGEGYQIFGVYRTREKAEKVYNKIMKEIGDTLTDEDSITITSFESVKLKDIKRENYDFGDEETPENEN